MRIRPFALLLACSCLFLAAVGPLSAQSVQGRRSTLHIPDSTSEGKWSGTWFHVSRDERVAIWLRGDGDVPELKLEYFRIGQPEQFTTDWTGVAEYENRGAPGRFSLRLLEGDGEVLSAQWDWDLQFADSGRTETSPMTIYRTGDGRQLVLLFDKFERRLRRGQNVQVIPATKTWTFRKASKRLVLWDELPF